MFIPEKKFFSNKYIINKDYGHLFHLKIIKKIFLRPVGCTQKKQTLVTENQHIFKLALFRHLSGVSTSLMTSKYTGGYIYQLASGEFPFLTGFSKKNRPEKTPFMAATN